jgi:hypothetical protein
MILKTDLQEVGCGHELGLPGLGEGQAAGFCEFSKEPLRVS